MRVCRFTCLLLVLCALALPAWAGPLAVKGYGDGGYGPAMVVTRDQMAVYVARAFELVP